MGLEKKFKSLELTKAEFRKLKREVIKEQYYSGKDFSFFPRIYNSSRINGAIINEEYYSKKYDIQNVIELFDGTDIRERVVSDKIKKIIQTRKNRKRKILGIVAAVAMGFSLPNYSKIQTKNPINEYSIGIDHEGDGIIDVAVTSKNPMQIDINHDAQLMQIELSGQDKN